MEIIKGKMKESNGKDGVVCMCIKNKTIDEYIHTWLKNHLNEKHTRFERNDLMVLIFSMEVCTNSSLN